MFNRGGQKRTMELGCGFRIVGHPREVEGKLKIHNKRCSTCSEFGAGVPEFSREAGNINGWNGCRGVKKPTKMMTTAFVNGVKSDYLVDASSIAEATEKVKLISSLEEEKLNSESSESESSESSDSDDEDPDLQHRKLVKDIIKLAHRWEGEILNLASNKYSGCGLAALPKKKLFILIRVMNEQIIYKQREEKIIMSCIDCSITKEMALETIKIKYPHLYEDVANNWDKYHKKYLETKKA
jgi:hypothetical protein